MLGSDNAICDDGERVGWQEIEEKIRYKEWGTKYPNADRRRANIPLLRL